MKISSGDVCLLGGKGVVCNENGVFLKLSHCLICNESENTVTVGQCPYYDTTGHDIIDSRYIRVPDNTSELNEYMCGPLNRKGLLCKECIYGFGVSVTSFGYRCSNCTNVWYGIPLYLVVEFLPPTLFYLMILL